LKQTRIQTLFIEKRYELLFQPNIFFTFFINHVFNMFRAEPFLLDFSFRPLDVLTKD